MGIRLSIFAKDLPSREDLGFFYFNGNERLKMEPETFPNGELCPMCGTMELIVLACEERDQVSPLEGFPVSHARQRMFDRGSRCRSPGGAATAFASWKNVEELP
jgi:uncharacterized protein with PIN domain